MKAPFAPLPSTVLPPPDSSAAPAVTLSPVTLSTTVVSRTRTAEIAKTQATTGTGVDALWAEIRRFREHSNDRRQTRDRVRQEARLRDLLGHLFVRHVERTVAADELARLVDAITARTVDPYSAADRLMRAVMERA